MNFFFFFPLLSSFSQRMVRSAGAQDHHLPSPASLEALFVLDTNVLLTHLKSVRELKDAIRPFNMSLLIPWIVIEELDGLKVRANYLGSVSHPRLISGSAHAIEKHQGTDRAGRGIFRLGRLAWVSRPLRHQVYI